MTIKRKHWPVKAEWNSLPRRQIAPRTGRRGQRLVEVAFANRFRSVPEALFVWLVAEPLVVFQTRESNSLRMFVVAIFSIFDDSASSPTLPLRKFDHED